jgi:hypothetical protein
MIMTLTTLLLPIMTIVKKLYIDYKKVTPTWHGCSQVTSHAIGYAHMTCNSSPFSPLVIYSKKWECSPI